MKLCPYKKIRTAVEVQKHCFDVFYFRLDEYITVLVVNTHMYQYCLEGHLDSQLFVSSADVSFCFVP